MTAGGKTVSIPWGPGGTCDLALPPRWDLVGVCAPGGLPPLADVGAALDRALAAPLGLAPLRQLVRPGQRVALVVDDASRPTPAHLLCDRILDEIEAGGVPAAQVKAVLAVGMHRPATRAEIERKVGERAFGRMPCTNHDAFDASLHVELGRTARGTRIALHHEVARADVRVLVGCVEPHVQAGFGGGYKNLCPGVAAADAIGHNHCLGAGPHDLGRIGGAPEAIPMRQDLEEFGRRLPGTTFAVNVVLDARQRVVKLAAGDADRVHRACIEAARTLYGVEVSEPADVVITGSHPLDLNVRQGVKSIVNVLGAARPGGVIVSLNRCELGLDDLPLPRLPLPPDWLVRRFLKLVRPEGIDFLLGRLPRSLPPENRFFVHFALQALARNRIVVYSPNLARDLAGVRLPVLVSADLDQVLAEAVRLAPARRRARCLVFPSGGVSYPIVTAGGASRPEGRVA